MKIDFICDVVCPWCAIGLNSLEQAPARMGGTLQADIHFQPFELNPQMPPDDEEIVEHLTRQFGATPADVERNREAIRQRGESVGFVFGHGKRHPAQSARRGIRTRASSTDLTMATAASAQ